MTGKKKGGEAISAWRRIHITLWLTMSMHSARHRYTALMHSAIVKYHLGSNHIMLQCTGKRDFKPMREAHKAGMCYEFAVQNLELYGAKRGQRAVLSPQRWDSSCKWRDSEIASRNDQQERKRGWCSPPPVLSYIENRPQVKYRPSFLEVL